MPIQTIPIELIEVGQRLRSLREADVATLMASIREIDLREPVTVVSRRSLDRDVGSIVDVFDLVAGNHRLEACRRLGRAEIRADVVEMNDLEVRLWEIDENLCRAELTVLERAEHLAERKTVYEEMHPDTKGGVAGGKARQKSATADSSFADVTAEKIGVSVRQVRQEVRRAKRIQGDVRDAIRETETAKNGAELDALADMGPEEQRATVALVSKGEARTVREARKKLRRAKKESDLAAKTEAASESLNTKLYNVIYADPPWRFSPYSRETGMDRAADNHYPTLPLEDITAMKVPAADDCVLYLWSTVPMLRYAMAVIEAWGFEYRSAWCWGKDKAGTGYWGRDKFELLLIAVKGDVPAPSPGTQPENLIQAPVGKHSQKPTAFRDIILELFPNLPKVELFARDKAEGWDTWGNEIAAA